MAVRIACFAGWSDTGKTGFIVACIDFLASRGIRSGAVKCVHHAGSFNLPGKDTTRFFEAGASAAIISGQEAHIIKTVPVEWNRLYLEALFPEVAVLLVEGRMLDDSVRVLVGGAATEQAGLKFPLADFNVLVTDDTALAETARSAGLVTYRSDQASNFVTEYLLADTV